jgi:hypothetical protein
MHPVGIPSGWEEIAAWCWGCLGVSSAYLLEYISRCDAVSNADNYNDPIIDHDWRISSGDAP